MKKSVTKEYRALLAKKLAMESELFSLPSGYISKKNIKGNVQYYLQRRNGSKIVGTYIRNKDVDTVTAQIARRKAITDKLTVICERLKTLETAAKMVDSDFYRQLLMYKLSSGMDGLTTAERKQCSSFGYAMNAIEGVPVSEETAGEVKSWEMGESTFCSVFENALRRYGFPVEVQ